MSQVEDFVKEVEGLQEAEGKVLQVSQEAVRAVFCVRRQPRKRGTTLIAAY